MKKYVKPELFLEEFELSQSVAACGWDMNYTDSNDCEAVGDPTFGYAQDYVIFNKEPECTITFDREVYCYEVPTAEEAFRIFRS